MKHGDASATDFAYTLALLRRGFSEEEIRERLLKEREDWTHHQGDRRLAHYLATTLRAARKIIP